MMPTFWLSLALCWEFEIVLAKTCISVLGVVVGLRPPGLGASPLVCFAHSLLDVGCLQK